MKALLVIDIQKGYIERYDECLLTRINQRIEYSVENSELIIYVKNIRKLRRGIKANKLTESLNACSPYIVCKETASAFSNDELHDILTQNQVTEIDIVGIDGNSCIASSAEDAADIVPGYYMNKTHWSTVYLDGEVPQEILADMISSSHRVLLSSLSKKAQREILDE